MKTELANTIGRFWSNNAAKSRTRWWHSPMIIRYVNSLVSGEPVDGISAGLMIRAKKLLDNRAPLEKGISVGCGNGYKEIQLITNGLVKSFDLFELSHDRISQGLELARKHGVEENIRYFNRDAMSSVKDSEIYELVHWNNALHHMLDVNQAIEWSRHILKSDGLFYMDDFVGASRFQWPGRQLAIASEVRKSLRGTKYLRNPAKKNLLSRKYLTCRIQRPDLKAMIQTDPSEAADSEQILPAILKWFPTAEVIKTGGVVYSLALADVIFNFDESLDEDCQVLESLLEKETQCINQGDTHYAICLATKN